MSSMYRAGHNKPRPRVREPLYLQESPRRQRKLGVLISIAVLTILVAVGFAIKAQAHPSAQSHNHVMKAPLAGVYNNY
jgi:hypothetical protein